MMFGLLGLVAVSPVVEATNKSDLCSGINSTTSNKSCGTENGQAALPKGLQTVTNVLLFIVGAAAVIVIVIGGIRFTTSAGDAAAVESGRKMIMYAAIGLVVAILAFAITNFVLSHMTAKGVATDNVAAAYSYRDELRKKLDDAQTALDVANESGDAAAIAKAQANYDKILKEYEAADIKVDAAIEEAEQIGADIPDDPIANDNNTDADVAGDDSSTDPNPNQGGGGNNDGGGSDTVPTNVAVSKALVIVVENHSYDQMKNNMKYTFRLAQKFGYANNYRALAHPSLPNYIAMATGSTQGITDDASPQANGFGGATVFGKAIQRGKTAKVYAESMAKNCQLVNSGKYVVRHNPWTYATSERTMCERHSLPTDAFHDDVANGTLPNVGMLIPNNCNNGHDCSLSTADDWIKGKMGFIFDGEDWKAERLAVIITADEDDKVGANDVLTVVIHPSIKSKVASCGLNHYSITKFYAEVSGTNPLGSGAGAGSIARCFGLKV